MSDYSVSQEEVAKLQEFLLNHPIDPAFDPQDLEFDCEELSKLNQMAARFAYDELKRIGQLPDGMK